MRKIINKLITALTLAAFSVAAAVPCFADSTVGDCTGKVNANTDTGVQLGDMLPMIICGVVLLVAIAVGIVCAVLKKKKAEEELEADSSSEEEENTSDSGDNE